MMANTDPGGVPVEEQISVIDVSMILVMREYARRFENCQDERGILAGNVMWLVEMITKSHGLKVMVTKVH